MGSLWVWTSEKSWAYKQRRRSKRSKSKNQKHEHDSRYQTLTSAKLPTASGRSLTLSATVRLESALQADCWLFGSWEFRLQTGNQQHGPSECWFKPVKTEFKVEDWKLESFPVRRGEVAVLGGGQFDSVCMCECVGWRNVGLEVGLPDYRTIPSGGPDSPPVTFSVSETSLDCDNTDT